MPRTVKTFRTWPLVEMIGILILGLGLCFAIAGIGVAFDDEHAKGEKPKVQQSVEEMKAKLVAAKVSDDQLTGLLRVHKSALIADAVHQHFLITSFFVLLSLLLASFGFSVMLLGKLRALAKSFKDSEQKSETLRG